MDHIKYIIFLNYFNNFFDYCNFYIYNYLMYEICIPFFIIYFLQIFNFLILINIINMNEKNSNDKNIQFFSYGLITGGLFIFFISGGINSFLFIIIFFY